MPALPYDGRQKKAKTRGDLEECRRLEEAAGFEIKFAKEGRLLLAGTDRFYEYEEGKEITSFAIDHYRSFYHGELHLSECGYILTSDVIEGENGMETTLPEGEKLCFLRWYEEETAREYWLR